MSDDILTATTQLTDALLTENTALTALDFAAACQVLERKQAATAALAEAQRRLPGAGRVDRVALHAAATRLQAVAEDNRRLLERAMRVQHRVIGILAQAARAADPAPRYARSGGYAARAAAGWALSASA